MTEGKTFYYELDRLHPEVRSEHKLLYEASQLRGYIDGLVGAVVVIEKGGSLIPKPRKKSEQDLESFLAAKKQEGIVKDGGSVVLGSQINRETRQVEEIRVYPWDFDQIRALFNKRNILNVALETFDKYLTEFNENPAQKSFITAQQESLILIRRAIDKLYQPKEIKEGSKNDQV